MVGKESPERQREWLGRTGWPVLKKSKGNEFQKGFMSNILKCCQDVSEDEN